jgi:predicted Rossmann fold nucleotide-binding protein DprA/Smf involved in DNA uptake
MARINSKARLSPARNNAWAICVIADNLDFSPLAFDSLLTATGLTPAELSSMLLHLELEGKIEALPGGRYCRLAKRA